MDKQEIPIFGCGKDARWWSRPEISCKYFLEGAELSIVLSRFSLSELFKQNSISTILFIVLSIIGIYTKTTKFRHRQPYRLSGIRPIMTISGLLIVCGYSTHCKNYILFPIKTSINGH